MNLRLLANENFPGEAVEALRVRGHEFLWVRTDSPGALDTVELASGCDEGSFICSACLRPGARRSGEGKPQGNISKRRFPFQRWTLKSLSNVKTLASPRASAA